MKIKNLSIFITVLALVGVFFGCEEEQVEKNKIKFDVTKDMDTVKSESSDLRYIVIKDSNSIESEPGDSLLFHYNIYNTDMDLLATSQNYSKPQKLAYGDKIIDGPGFQEGRQLMSEGEKFRLLIPYYLAFGEEGNSQYNIPPYTDLVIDVVMLEIQKKSDE